MVTSAAAPKKGHRAFLAVFLLWMQVSHVAFGGQESPPLVASVAAEARRSVVLISVYGQDGRLIGQGSGFIVNSAGTVATSYHVVRDAVTGMVKLHSGALFQIAEVRGVNCDADLALIALQATQTAFPHLQLIDSGEIRVGDPVIAIGNPLALEGTVSMGIVSAFRQTPDPVINVIQTTAPVSQGSSGGVLLDAQGRAIGVITATRVGGQNLNFAVAAEHIKSLQAGPMAAPLGKASTLCETSSLRSAEAMPSALVYAGVWKSNSYDTSGNVAIRLQVDGNNVTGEIRLTGSRKGYSGGGIAGTARQLTRNSWALQLEAENAELQANAVLTTETMTGDYTFRYGFLGLGADRGQWIMKRHTGN